MKTNRARMNGMVYKPWLRVVARHASGSSLFKSRKMGRGRHICTPTWVPSRSFTDKSWRWGVKFLRCSSGVNTHARLFYFSEEGSKKRALPP